ncbi:MAG TPA: hypothetical protein VFB31_07850 [Pseudolabrys sp.]|nr:hypothetical protein [Pseudolabrys sp.]
MTRTVIAAAALLALLIAPASSAKRAHRAHAAPAAAEPRIACTVLGCMPVPPQCGQTYGRTMKGTPTGFDVIVCPPGVWPFK